MSTQFHSLLLSPNMSMSVEGYLICHNVPICRSGYQDYYGSELEDFPGYKASWGLQPDKKYSVFRPPSEVLHPDTIRSFEGKTITNEHPVGDVVTIDNEKNVNCGHLQNVKQGPDFDGQVTLQADFVIKDSVLINRIRPDGNPESGIREVSCGYTLKLRRRQDGAVEMFDIRGNHAAVVEKGRAGPRIAIMDAAPPEITPRKETQMSLREMIFGRGLKAYAEEASPEDLAKLVRDGSVIGAGTIPTSVATDSAEPKPKKDETIPVSLPNYDGDPHRAAAHAALDRALEAAKSSDGMGIDAVGKPRSLSGLRKEVVGYFSLDEDDDPQYATDKVAVLIDKKVEPGETAADDDDDDDDDDKHAKDAFSKKGHVAEDDDDDDDRGAKDAAADDDDDATDAFPAKMKKGKEDLESGAADEISPAIKIDNKGKSVLKQLNDSVKDYIRASRPVIADIAAKPRNRRSSRERAMLDTYNTAVRTINRANGQAYSLLVKAKVPKGIPALATDSSQDRPSFEEMETVSRFYEGVPYRVGKQKHDAYLAQKGSK